jgi:cysteinyl-tRNA synthetase
MSKSLGNFYTLRDLLGMGYTPESIRYLLASVPYRKKLNFTFDGLKAAATSIDRLRNYKLRLETAKFADGANEKLSERTRAAHSAFDEALDDDLNTAEALAAAFEYVRDTNSAMDAGEFTGRQRSRSARVSRAIRFRVRRAASLGAHRRSLRCRGRRADRGAQRVQEIADFARADQIRKDLAAQNIILEDTKEGVRWKRHKQ